jgi:hypothetical protein
MVRSSKRKKIADSSEEIGYRVALQRLARNNLSLIIESLSEVILDLSRANEFSVPERKEALCGVLALALRGLDDLSKEPLTAKPRALWQNRNRSHLISPFSFLKQNYSNEIAEGSLTKFAVRQSDFALYRALLNPYWKAREPKDNVFSRLPSKKTIDDKALQSLPKNMTRAAIIKTLPREIREMFRILHVAEMRRHRSKKA